MFYHQQLHQHTQCAQSRHHLARIIHSYSTDIPRYHSGGAIANRALPAPVLPTRHCLHFPPTRFSVATNTPALDPCHLHPSPSRLFPPLPSDVPSATSALSSSLCRDIHHSSRHGSGGSSITVALVRSIIGVGSAIGQVIFGICAVVTVERFHYDASRWESTYAQWRRRWWSRGKCSSRSSRAGLSSSRYYIPPCCPSEA